MFPPVHPGVAYLVYAGWVRLRGEAPPGDLATLGVVVGAAIPDLVDQSLSLLVAMPSTRTVGHSLLVAIPASILVVVLVRERSLPNAVGEGVAVGYLSHPVADALWPLLLGKYAELGFLLWPITHSPAYEGQKELFVVGEFAVTTLWLELPILAVALIVWRRDGSPGLEPVRRRLGL